ncbi:MAG: hypothetical protein LH478_09545 [Chitinophagaceae bacterium]|nr:hypothetical protein [Chitinophagaceae bacterium]
MTNILNIQHEGESLTIEIIADEHDIKYKVNLDHPVYLEKDIDEEGVEYWFEVGGGRTLRAKEIGEQIDAHPEFM